MICQARQVIINGESWDQPGKTSILLASGRHAALLRRALVCGWRLSDSYTAMDLCCNWDNGFVDANDKHKQQARGRIALDD